MSTELAKEKQEIEISGKNVVVTSTNISHESEPLTVEKLAQYIKAIDEVKEKILRKGVDYEKYEWTDNPILKKPGAERILFMFHLAVIEDLQIIELENHHREYRVITKAIHKETGAIWGTTMAICTTLESPFRYRTAEIKCPSCGKSNIRKSKKDGGWYCWDKTGGCGREFESDNERITKQPRGKIENPNIADEYHNACRKSAKRSMVALARLCTASSYLFDEGLDDLPGGAVSVEKNSQPASDPYEAIICPKCGIKAVTAGKAEWNEGWGGCRKNKGGCGAKFETKPSATGVEELRAKLKKWQKDHKEVARIVEENGTSQADKIKIMEFFEVNKDNAEDCFRFLHQIADDVLKEEIKKFPLPEVVALVSNHNYDMPSLVRWAREKVPF